MKHPVTLSPGPLVTLSWRRRQRWLVASLHLLTLLLLALHLYVRTLPPTPTALPEAATAEAAWWGLWPVTYVPAWTLFLATFLISGWIVGWWVRELTNNFQFSIFNFQLRITRGTSLVILAIFLLAFYALPIVHTRWGDAYLLSKALAWPDPALRLTHSWQAPLDLFLHSQLWLHLHARLGWADAMPVYRLLSPLAGLLYLLAAMGVARMTTITPAWLTFGLLTSLGVLQLFFGYIENYSFAAAGILLYLWLGLRFLTDQASLWLAASALALTNALHPSTVILAPSLLYLGWVDWRKGVDMQNKAAVPALLCPAIALGLPMLLVALAVIGGMEWGGHGLATLTSTDRPGGGDARLFVPLWATTTRWEHYTMFSWLHLRDFLNEQLLVAPVVLPGLLVTLFAHFTEKARPWPKVMNTGADQDAQPASPLATARLGPKTPPPNAHHSPAVMFLLIATVAYLLFVWVWNPDYGGQRDWDLFSLAAIPATVLLATTLPRRFADQRYLQAGTIPLLMLQWLHLAAWVYQNTLPWTWPS